MTLKIKIFIGVSAMVVLIFSVVSFFVAKKIASKIVSEVKIHYHAGFVVFDNGKKVDFSDNKYMFIKPCTIDGKEDEESENPQLEKAHLHDNVGDVIHIEEDDAKWSDLFTNINFPVDYSKVTGYINGEIITDFQDIKINKDDSLVLFIGKPDTKLLSQGVTAEYIEEQAKKSGTCSD